MRNSQLFRATALVLLFLLVSFLSAQEAKDDSSNTIAAYAVAKGKLTLDSEYPVTAPDKKDQATIWKAVTTLVPPALLNLVTRLEFFEVPESDAATETDGWALQSDDSQSFTLGLSITSAKLAFVDRDEQGLPEFEQTIIHEFGHVLSFRASQMDENATGTLQIEEGTLKSDGYLNVFYEKFWKKTYPKHGTDATSDEEGTKLYLTAPASFVSEYAATGPLEDFAESFAWFVTNDKPKGKDLKDQKVLQFYAWPELTGFRDQFRKGLASL
ncbi:MAG: hypothetical protein WCG80_05495 [Spirochaetales bacterium]